MVSLHPESLSVVLTDREAGRVSEAGIGEVRLWCILVQNLIKF